MPKPQKEAIIARLKNLLADAKAVVLTGYRGVTVAEMRELRNKLREVGAEYHVVKNTLMRIATREVHMPDLAALLRGPVAIAFVTGDPTPAIKILDEFRKNTEEKLRFVGGLVGGRPLTGESVLAMATLPPRPVLLAHVVGAFQAPICGLVNVLQGPIRKLAYTLDAIMKQKEKAA